MAYKPKDQFFLPIVNGNVRTTGGSLTLGVGELAIVNLKKTSRNGTEVVSDFTDLPEEYSLAIRMGAPDIGVTRSLDNFADSSFPFQVSDVRKVYVSAPDRKGMRLDDMIIGFNGKNGTEIDLDNSESDYIEITLKGEAMGMTGLKDSTYSFRLPIHAPIIGVKGVDWTMQEIIEKAVIRAKTEVLPGNIPVSNYIDIILVNSENPVALPGTGSTFYNLAVEQNGYHSDFGDVQAQYPGLDVKRGDYENGIATYSVIAGVAPDAYVFKPSYTIKGCDVCEAGYSAQEQGAVYQVTLVDDAGDSTATVQGLPGASASTAIKLDSDGDTSFYTVVLDNALTELEISTFVSANPTAELVLISENVSDLCVKPAKPSVSWIEGETCNASSETFTITLPDNECGENRLAELQSAYPELTIALEGSAFACQTVYQTTVVTSLVCEECAPIFRDLFLAERPEEYAFTSWENAEKVYSADAKMGIRVRAKELKLSSGELLRDDIGFYTGAVEVSLVGGVQNYVNENFLTGVNGRMNVKVLSRFAPAQNLGGHLRRFEDEAIAYMRFNKRHKGNNYAKLSFGEETRFNGLEQYLVYSVVVAQNRFDGDQQQAQNKAFTWHIPVELGKQGRLEELLNKLAVAAGVKTVQALAK